MKAQTFPQSFRLAMLWLSVFALAATAAEPAAPKPPDRRELWVPVDKLGHVLEKNAVLLTREQYEALLRDAERERGLKSEAPVAAAISSAEFRAVPDGKAALIHAELRVNVLRDGWSSLPLDFAGAAIGEVKLDGDGVLTPRNPALRAEAQPPQAAQQKDVSERPALLLLRGRGEHKVTLEITATISGAGGISTLALGVPSVAAGSFTLALPAGTKMETLGDAVRVTKTADSTTATLALSPSRNAVAFAWKGGAENDGKIPVRAQAIVRYDIDAEKITGSYRMHLEAPLGDLPLTFEFALPAGVKVLVVRADELRGWEAADGKIVAKFQDGARKELDLEIGVELQPLVGKDGAETVLPMPVLQGASRLDGELHIAGADNVTIKDVTADARMRRMPTSEDRGERGFFGAYEFSGSGVAPKVVIERAVPGLESDLDTLVEFRSDAIFVTRTLTLREQKGRRFSAAITMPASEEFLDVRRIEEAKPVAMPPATSSVLRVPEANPESEPEWTREGGRLLIKWSEEAAQPRVFRVRTRIEPEKWTQLPAEGISLALGDAKIADSAKVTGYIALTADPAFRIEAQPGETLERRDGRSTPVQGEYAWFRRDAFDLTIKIARRPSEVLAALTGYVLPLEGVLDVHAVMNYQFLGGGTRAVKIRVPKDIAQNFHFEGPQVAERALDGDVWTVTFQKELTGNYALSIAAQVPVGKQAGDGKNGAKGYSFAVKVPVISPLDVVRASGLWAVEANTETEIRFDAVGMNELDSLLAPQLADYAPRHRVIGVFGWLGADYALTLNGVRHAPAGMLAAVVDALELNTVISTSGLHRHEAIYRLRASGVEYFDVALPQGAALLSAAIDGTAVKPVADRPGSVRLPLPAKRDANTGVIASLVYETGGDAWKNCGKLALGAPSIAAGIPVLKSTWRVWVPEGFSFSDIESNLPVPEALPEELLVRTISKGAMAVLASPFVVKYSSRIEPPDFVAGQNEIRASVSESKSGMVRQGVKGDERAAAGARLEAMSTTGNKLSGDAKGFAEQAKQAFEQDKFAEALKLFDKALGVAPNNVYLLSNRAVVQFRMGKFKQAEESFKKALAIAPEDAFCWSTIGIIYYSEEKYDDAVNALTKSLAINPRNPTAHNYLGITAAQKGWLEAAEKELNAAIQLDPKYSDAWYNLAVTHTLKQPPNNVEARKAYTKAIELGMGKDDAMEALLAQAGEKSGLDGLKRDEKTSAPSSVQITRKLNSIIFPKIDFRDSTVLEALEFVATKSKSLDPDGQGVNIVLKLGDEESSKTRITLTLNNVPMIEVIKYITNLANLKYKIEPFAVAIVPLGTATEELFIKQWKVPPSLFRAVPGSTTPTAGAAGAEGTSNAKDFLAASGVTFGQGAFAMYSPASSTLIVKGTQDQLDLVERIIEIGAADVQPGAAAPAKPQSARDDGAKSRTAQPRKDEFQRYPGHPSTTSLGLVIKNLLPVTLDLPKTGPALVFDGLYAPERLVMRYDDWWSRARALWLWFVAGGVAFYLFASRRPWWRTLWAVLVLSALPLCVSAAWMPVCNALLGGWLAGLVLNRIGAWCVFRERKEVLA